MLMIMEEMGILIKMGNRLIMKNIKKTIIFIIIMMQNVGMHQQMEWKAITLVLVLTTINWDFNNGNKCLQKGIQILGR